MPDISETLARLGLQQYQHVLLENGFNSWEVVLDITEDDFQELGFKLGHRRILQREIANFRGIPPVFSLDSDGTPTPSPLSTQILDSFPFPSQGVSTPNARGRESKRRYRRHPKPDEHAPKKPKTAYVNFADHLRTDPAIRALSFVDIAKEVGRQWQLLAPEKKHIWECNAARAMQEYEASMDEYRKTEQHAMYQQYLEDFRKKQAQAKERKEAATRTDDSPGMADSFSRLSSSSPVSFTSTPTPDLEKFNDSLNQAMSELGIGRQDPMSLEARAYDSSHLPPQDLIRSAAAAMIEGMGPLLFIWTPLQAQEIVERIYSPAAAPDATTLAEGLTMAACGAQYLGNSIPDGTRRALHASATAHFNQDMVSAEPLRAMRVLAALSFYSFLEKHLSARYLVVAGLQIARCKMPQYPNTVNADLWRKLYRTLVFMDCWLACTLGYSTEVTVTDISCAFSAAWSPADINDAIHHHVSSIALIASEVVKTLYGRDAITSGHLNVLTAKLDAWYRDLPTFMHLDALISSQGSTISFSQRRAILLTHMMYLGAVILLYRQLLMITSDKPATSSLDQQLDPYLKTYRDQCVAASQQTAHVLRLLGFEGCVTKKCWVVIYWTFSACVSLLSDVAYRMLDTSPYDVEDDLSHAKVCLDALEACSPVDALASRYTNILSPFYNSLKSIQHRYNVKSKTSIHALLHPSSEISPPTSPGSSPTGQSLNIETMSLAEKLSNLLRDPFGRRQESSDGSMRRVRSSDGSYTVFWWK